MATAIWPTESIQVANLPRAPPAPLDGQVHGARASAPQWSVHVHCAQADGGRAQTATLSDCLIVSSQTRMWPSTCRRAREAVRQMT